MKFDLNKKNVVLGISGGIAAFKSVELARLLIKGGASVRVIMTRNSLEFIGALTFKALTNRPVCTSLFDKTDDATIQHIDWAEKADAVIIAPATANILGKLANGIADDALSTFMLAVTAPVLLCPSMNTHMYENRLVQRNIEKLKELGYFVVEPDSGILACGTVGPGRLPSPEDILEKFINCLTPKDIPGRKILITAGPTMESIDPVRFISNHSSGKMGYALARAAEQRGAEVTLVAGPNHLPDPSGVNIIHVKTAKEMAQAIFDQMTDAEVIIKAAAVSDYRPKIKVNYKIKKKNGGMVLELKQNQDILKELGRRKKNQFLVGFAAETENLAKNAEKKLAEKNLDMIVGNVVGSPGSGFNADTNKVTLFYRGGKRESFELMEKREVADIILDRVFTAIKSEN